LNDWTLVKKNPAKLCDESEVEELQEMLLDNLATIMAETVVEDGIGAFLTDDPEVDGYYLVKWATTPYTLQEDVILKEYTPHIKIATGELVCNARYFNHVQRVPYWYTPSDTPTVVRMQQVILPDVALLRISRSNKLPNTCNKASATRLKACKICLDDHDQILEDINRRDRLCYDEASSEEEDNDDDSDDESSRPHEDDDDMVRMLPPNVLDLTHQFDRSDHDMIQPHAKYRRRERARSRPEKKKTVFDHLGRSQAPASAPNGQNVGIQPFVSGDNLHVVGSWHDPTTCKVSASRTSDKPFLGKIENV
jgi:hypothetical protein